MLFDALKFRGFFNDDQDDLNRRKLPSFPFCPGVTGVVKRATIKKETTKFHGARAALKGDCETSRRASPSI